MKWSSAWALSARVGLAAWLAVAGTPAALADVLLQVRGDARIERGGQSLAAVAGNAVAESDELVTPQDAELLLQFDDGARLAARPGSRLVLEVLTRTGPLEARQAKLRVLRGGLRYVGSVMTERRRISFETSSVTIGIRGTDLEIAVPPPGAITGTYLKVNSGQAVLTGLDGTSVEVGAGEVAHGSEPQLTARGVRSIRRPAARLIPQAPSDLFPRGMLDEMLR